MTNTATGEALRKALDGPFHEVKERWRTQISGDDLLRSPDLSMTQARDWTLERVVWAAENKLVTAGFPEAYGGTGSIAESVANFEMLSMGDLSLTIKSGVQHGLFGGAIMNLGTAWHHEKFLPDAIAVRLPGCFAMTELDHGSDVQSIETTITWLPETSEFEVNTPHEGAKKAYIGNAAQHGRMAAVFGQLIVGEEHQGVHVVLVPIRDDFGDALPGITIGDHGLKGGLVGVDNGTIMFDHIRAPREHLLNRHGGVTPEGVYEAEIENKGARFFTMLATLVRGRICVGGGASSVTRKALTIATKYALQRTQFRAPGLGEEIPLLDYQTHQHKLLPNIAKAYAYGFAQNELAMQLQRVHDDPDGRPRAARELEARAAGLKAVQTRWANDTVQLCREACGGAGFIAANGLTLPRQDVDVFATFEGDNTVLLQLLAKALLLDYRSTWGDMDLRSTAQATMKLMASTFMERTTARSLIDRLVASASRKPEQDKLCARGWHVELFEDRERHIVESLALRMRAAARLPHDDQFAALSECQEHMLSAATAHIDRVVLEAFIHGIEQCSDSYIRALLVRVCDLYALTVINEHRAWFLEHERFDSKRSKAVTAAVNKLCAELRPLAGELVEGLGVPEGWLNSAFLSPAD